MNGSEKQSCVMMGQQKIILNDRKKTQLHTFELCNNS